MSNPATLKPFKKGKDKRRNTTGKNKGSRSLVVLLREALSKIAEGQTESYEILLTKRILKKAIQDGDSRIIELIFKYLERPPVQEMDVTTLGQAITGIKYIVPKPPKKNGTDTGTDV